MTVMSMNRAIHGAFRRDLDRFVLALDAFVPGDLPRARRLGTAWENLDQQLTVHHEGEHAIAWPALAAVGVSSDLLATMDAEHDAMATALTRTRTAMAAFTTSGTAADAATARSAFEELRAVALTHLDHEEAELEPVYEAKRDAPEIVAMGKQFGKVSPSQGGRFFAWVLDGASADERAAVTDTVPGPVLTIIGGVFGRSYRKDIASVWTTS
jgi:hypothetical protein